MSRPRPPSRSGVLAAMVLPWLAAATWMIALLIGTADIRHDGHTCGMAILSRNPLPVVQVSQDRLADIAAEQFIRTSCAQALSKQRFLLAIPAVCGCVLTWLFLRTRPEERDPIPRSIIRVRRVTDREYQPPS